MRKRISQLFLATLVCCTVSVTGCGGGDEPTIIGGPTQEILDWQAKNRAEFQSAMEKEHGKKK